MKKIILTLITAGIFVLPYSCKEAGQSFADELHADEHDHEEGDEKEVSLTEGQIKAIKLEFGEIELKELEDAVKANGFLKVPNRSKAQVTSLYSGQIKSLNVQPGSYVKKGQTVAVIENPNQVFVQEQYLTVVGQIQMAETEVKRQKELYEGNAGALKNLQYAESQLQTLRTQRSSLVKQLQMMGINPGSISSKNLRSTMTISAPISGVVGAVLVDIGSYVDVSTPIAEVVNNSNLHLDLDVFEKDLPLIEKGQVIHFTMTNNPSTEYDAVIYSIGSTFRDESKSVPVHATVQGDKTGLIDGMNVVAIISIGKNPVPAVPTEAIVNVGAEDFIFIEKGTHEHDGETEILFEKIPVVKGVTDIGYSQITPLVAIPDNARIVTKGAFFVMAKLTNTGEGHDH